MTRVLTGFFFALIGILMHGAFPPASQAGLLVLVKSTDLAVAQDPGSAKTAKSLDGANTLHDYGSVILGASIPALQEYYVVNTKLPASGGASGSFKFCGDLPLLGIPETVNLDLGEAARLNLVVDTSIVGQRTGTLVLTRDGTLSPNSNGIGQPDKHDRMTLQVSVLDHSDPSFAQSSSQTNLVLDFGTIGVGESLDLEIDLFNRVRTPGLTAGLDLVSLSVAGETGVFSTSLSPFVNLNAGSSLSSWANFSPTAAGSFEASYVLHFSDENLIGAATKDLTLQLRGMAVSSPEPSSLALSLSGIAMLGVGLWRRRRVAPAC